MRPFDAIADLFERRGRAAYLGEAVSQAEHALQSAHLAEREGASDALVVAALLHDVGHILDETSEDPADHGVDGRHEARGAAWLRRAFGPDVVEPVRLHVPAKRYLCASDSAYRAGLSPASLLSLGLQGGPFDADRVARFETEPFFRDAVCLRRWDDAAKIRGLTVPSLAHYRDRVEAVALHPTGAPGHERSDDV